MSYTRDLKYILGYSLSFELLGLLQSLYWIQNKTGAPSQQQVIEAEINEQWGLGEWIRRDVSDMIDRLKKDGFVVDYRADDKKLGNLFEQIRLTPKFQQTYFIDAELAYEQAKEVYPPLMNVPGGGTRSTMLARHEELREYYFNSVIDGGDPQAHERFVRITTALFKSGKKKKNAEVGFQTFLQSFKEIAKQYEEEESEKVEDNWWLK
jgi:hypothetical protein